MMFQKFVSVALVASMLTSTSLCFADETKQVGASSMISPAPALVPGEQDVGAAVSPMKKGQLAPFTGVLLSPRAIATVMTELDTFDAKLKIELDKVKADAVANCTFGIAETQAALGADKRVLQSQLDDRIKQNQILEDQLKRQESSSSNGPLWAGLGFGVGVAVTVLTSVIIVRASK